MSKLSTHVSTKEAADILGVAISTISQFRDQGLLTGSKGKRNWRYLRADVETLKVSRDTEPVIESKPKRPTRARTIEKAEEALAERVIERFGVEAMNRTYQPVVKWATDVSSPKSPGIPMLFISDVHYGEVVDPQQVLFSNAFSSDICARRLKHTFEQAVTLLKMHLAAPQYDGIVLVLGGDMINGGLHEDSAFSDESTPLVQAIEIARLLSDGVAFLADEFPKVDIYCVPGNHGRLTRRSWAKFYAQTNLDWLAYVMLKDYCRDLPNVEVHAPPVRDLTFEVAGRRYRLSHGDQFRGGDGIIGPLGPVTRGDVRKRHSASLMPAWADATYDTLLVGHFHQLLMLTRLIMNGSVKGFDEFALSINVPYEPPQQALWTVHPDHGHTWYMPVLCDDLEHRTKLKGGSQYE